MHRGPQDKAKRLREIDFLRGVAIILVLLAHSGISTYTANFGRIGVDLFFVLSGYLVSDLLFKEYTAYGEIRPINFLVRRGFKIYPLYYLTYIIYLIPILINNRFKIVGFVSDMTFTQNYIWGFGYAYAPSWSLAVEEHFYFLLTLVFLICAKRNSEPTIFHDEHEKMFGKVELSAIAIMLLCLVLRIFANLMHPEQSILNYTQTHLRIDSLASGVLIAYLYNYKKEILCWKFNKNKIVLLSFAICGLTWTPFVDVFKSFFAKTAGFTICIFSFSMILCGFIISPTINTRLNKIFSKNLVDTISKIGQCSYSIYIMHVFIIETFDGLLHVLGIQMSAWSKAPITISISILVGMVMTVKVEKYFLVVRDKYFPRRIALKVS